MLLGEIFLTQAQTISGCPDQTKHELQKIDPTWPGSKNFDPELITN